MLTGFNVNNYNFSHTVHWCSTSIHPLSERHVLVHVSLRPGLLQLVSSHRPEQAPHGVNSAGVFATLASLRVVTVYL